MTVIDVVFEVPKEIAEGLARGDYKLNGGVIQDLRGRTVRWLQPTKVAERVADQLQPSLDPALLAGQVLQLAVSAEIVREVREVRRLAERTLTIVQRVHSECRAIRREQLEALLDPVRLGAELLVQSASSAHPQRLARQARGHLTAARVQLTRVLDRGSVGELLELGASLPVFLDALLHVAALEARATREDGEAVEVCRRPLDEAHGVYGRVAERLQQARGRIPRDSEIEGLVHLSRARDLASAHKDVLEDAKELQDFAARSRIAAVYDSGGRHVGWDIGAEDTFVGEKVPVRVRVVGP